MDLLPPLPVEDYNVVPFTPLNERRPLTGPSWHRPVAAGLADLLTFATDHPATWRRWLGR